MTLGKTIEAGEPRAAHRRPKRPYKTRVRMPSMLDPHRAAIEGWLATEPQLTALAILGRLTERRPDQFGPRQHSIVQRLLRTLRAGGCAADHRSAATGPDRPALWTARAMLVQRGGNPIHQKAEQCRRPGDFVGVTRQ